MNARERLYSRGVALRRLSAAALAIVVLLAAGRAQAQSGKGDYMGGWTVSGNLGYAIPNTDEYGNSLAWRFGVGYSPIPQFEIALELGRFTSSVFQPEPDGVPNHDIASGELEVLPVCLAVQYHIPLEGTMTTFNLLAGGGYYFVDYTMADAQRAFFTASGDTSLPDQVVRNTWGAHLGAGLEYAVTGWFSATIDARYLFLAPEVSGSTRDGHQIDGSLNLNTWLFTGGLKVAF